VRVVGAATAHQRQSGEHGKQQGFGHDVRSVSAMFSPRLYPELTDRFHAAYAWGMHSAQGR
jgi:hypothetical protein